MTVVSNVVVYHVQLIELFLEVWNNRQYNSHFNTLKQMGYRVYSYNGLDDMW